MGSVAWALWIDAEVDGQSRWHSANAGRTRSNCALGDHLVGELMHVAHSTDTGTTDTTIARCASALRNRLASYEKESRLLMKLARHGEVVLVLQRAVEAALGILNLLDTPSRDSWYQHLHHERDEQMKLYEKLLTDDRKLMAETGDEDQQLEILTVLKHSFDQDGDLLTQRELDVTSAVYDSVARRANVIAVTSPKWLSTSEFEWSFSEMTPLDDEEECIRETIIWAELNHPNILKIYGACHVGEHGILHEANFLDVHPYWREFLGCARGLRYMHDRGFVHRFFSRGSLRSSKSEGGDGVLLGFGLVPLSEAIRHGIQYSTWVERQGDDIHPSVASDVLAFGHHIFESLLFWMDGYDDDDDDNEAAMLAPSMTGRLPDTRPEFLDEDGWRLLVGMCADNAAERTNMTDVIRQIEVLASQEEGGKNFSIHHDIDQLIFASPLLGNGARAHRWEPIWNQARDNQRKILAAHLEDPSSFLDQVEEESNRGEALALLQFEAHNHFGTRSAPSVLATQYNVTEAVEEDSLPAWFIPPYQVNLGNHAADGSFGAVYYGQWLDTDVVVKQVTTDQLDRANRLQFRHEANLWFGLNHVNLVKLYGACHEGRPFFVCEKASEGTIGSFLKGKGRWEIWDSIRDAARGLKHLHEHSIVHGDLKGNNILVCDDGLVKLADFGLSSIANRAGVVTDGIEGALGAFRWKAPECILGARPTFASDIFSFGMCIIEIATGDFPWGKDMSDPVVKFNVAEKKMIPPRPKSFNDTEWELVTRMCKFDPQHRINAGAVVSFVDNM
ncbi:hypothetical protein BBP00_00001863 [Phytophthora kernoviae]|uniref:Protein kinase domain-containing protein n=1 Tax=Phytophthora kernoviae TaxID=325452 RepID=A0A3F2RZ75_9STRA|nr:hypothetical protein BBP00_00001863 [Phytophthora kernoviae]